MEEIVNLQNSENGGKLDIKVNGRTYEPFKVIQEFAALSAMDNDDQEINESMTKQQIKQYESEKHAINKHINELSEKQKYPYLFKVLRRLYYKDIDLIIKLLL